MIVDASTQNIIRRAQIFVLLDVVVLCSPVAGSSWKVCICPKQLLVSTCARVPVLLFLSSCMSLICLCSALFLPQDIFSVYFIDDRLDYHISNTAVSVS